VLILKDLEKLDGGTANMGNVQAERSWKQHWWSAEKLHGRTGSDGINAAREEWEEGKQFEAAKQRAQVRIACGYELVKRFAGNGEI
jgi:hypothetical protein